MIRFALTLGLLAIVLWGAATLLPAAGLPFPRPSWGEASLAILWPFTVWSCWFVTRQPESNFVRAYLVTAVLRMVTVVALAALLVWDDPRQRTPNIIFLLVVYLAFVVAEIIFLTRKKATERVKKG